MKTTKYYPIMVAALAAVALLVLAVQFGCCGEGDVQLGPDPSVQVAEFLPDMAEPPQPIALGEPPAAGSAATTCTFVAGVPVYPLQIPIGAGERQLVELAVFTKDISGETRDTLIRVEFIREPGAPSVGEAGETLVWSSGYAPVEVLTYAITQDHWALKIQSARAGSCAVHASWISAVL